MVLLSRLRTAAIAMSVMVATVLMPAVAVADPGICAGVSAQLAQHGSVNPHLLAAAARANRVVISQLTEERAAVSAAIDAVSASRATLADALTALQQDVATLGEQMSTLQSELATTLADLNVTGLVDRAITRQLGVISTWPDGVAKTAAIAEQLQARAINDARRAALLEELAALRGQLASDQAQVTSDTAAELVVANELAALDAQLAAMTARIAAIEAQLALGGCRPA